MNRIYQGRVTDLQLQDAEGEFHRVHLGEDGNACPLWRHHIVVQDAINYYLLALGALADPEHAEGDRLIRDLRTRLRSAWEEFPRPGRNGARSLRDSVAPWLGLPANAGFSSAVDTVLEGNEAQPGVRADALALLLSRCTGAGGIQQGGRTYLPMLCDPQSKATFEFGADALVAAEGKGRLAEVLHGAPTAADLKALAAELELAWTVKIEPGKFFVDDDAKARLCEAADYWRKRLESREERAVAALADPAQARNELVSLADKIKGLNQLKIPRNRKAAKGLTFATLLFKYFPSEVTATILRCHLKKPPSPKKAAAGETGSTARKTAAEQERFSRFGDDPLKLARGRRGFVFRAFTALPAWNPSAPGKPAWKEFDIAVFKEALKALNQFKLKTLEREEKSRSLSRRIGFMTGSGGHDARQSSGAAKLETPDDEAAEEEDDQPVARLAGDPRYDAAQALERELTRQLGLPEEDPFRITFASLRGFRDMAEEWNKVLHSRRAANLSETSLENELVQVVKRYQAGEQARREIGSVLLLLALCQPAYWCLWERAANPEDQDEVAARRRQEGLADNMLVAVARLHQLQFDFDRVQQPVNLTPAEPEHSRRLIQLSDFTGKSKVKFGTNEVEVSLVSHDGAAARAVRAKLRYSAPRLARDGLLGSDEPRWLQPMTTALGLPLPEPGQLKHAVSLMPDFTRDREDERNRELRHLLNFPLELDPTWIHEGIGRSQFWINPFNGTKEKALHLHWPGTAGTDASRKAPWWEQPELIARGFTVLSNDLGQRSAGAWALLRVTATDPRRDAGKRVGPVISVGHDGTREWFAEVVARGMHRLPGEGIQGTDPDEGRRFGDTRGRRAHSHEYDDAVALAGALRGHDDDHSGWVGRDRSDRSFAEQNDGLLALAGRRLSRLATFHRWSCFGAGNQATTVTPQMLGKLRQELDGWQQPEVRSLLTFLEEGSIDLAAFRRQAEAAFLQLREDLGAVLVRLANRVVPLRGWRWEWKTNPRGTNGELKTVRDQKSQDRVRGQRGLSLKRIEQLELLRRLFLRYNRALERQPGEPVAFGRDDRGRETPEPCQYLLEKINAIKEQRINQTAHLVLAQALGVRLSQRRRPRDERRQLDIHGEYEPIPGRSPVDFIVMEDLSRYLTAQGRAPSENSRLMKWAHRAVLDKVKMLAQEPFAIPVVEVAAAYSSRFDAVTGIAGSRYQEMSRLPDFLRQRWQKRADNGGTKVRSQEDVHAGLLRQFAALEPVNETRRAAGKPPRTLLTPMPGGALFLDVKSGALVQADVNAAVNLGLRAIAAPDALHVHRRLRTIRKGGEFRLRGSKDHGANKREVAAFAKASPLKMDEPPSAKLASASNPNFFYDPDRLTGFDRARFTSESPGEITEVPVTSGVALWSHVREESDRRCLEVNHRRLEKWGIDPASLPPADLLEDDDQIPM